MFRNNYDNDSVTLYVANAATVCIFHAATIA